MNNTSVIGQYKQVRTSFITPMEDILLRNVYMDVLTDVQGGVYVRVYRRVDNVKTNTQRQPYDKR